MFIPLTIRHGYDRRTVAIWALASLVLMANLFFLLVPGWLLDIEYKEVLSFTAFDRDKLHDFNFLAYAFFYPNSFLFLFDMAGLLFFGMAVEARLGAWRTLLIFLVALPFGAFFHGLYQPSDDIAGMTCGVIALVGAAVLIYGYSETDGIALLPIPPNYRVGFTFTWTIFLILAYLIGAFVWALAAPRDAIQITGGVGLAASLLFGMAACALLNRGQIPILKPEELDPSTIRRMEDQKRREEVNRQLQEDGLFSQSAEEAFFLPSETISEQNRQPAQEPIRSSDIDMRKQSLIKMVMLKNAADLAQSYQQFIEDFPHACLASGPQFDLAMLLEKSFFTEPALHAYERLIQCHPHSPAAERALFHAGRLLSNASGREADAIRLLDRFIQTEPARHDLLEAQTIIKALKEKTTGEKPTPAPSVSEPNPADEPNHAANISSDSYVKPVETRIDVFLPTETERASEKPAVSPPDEEQTEIVKQLKKVRIGNAVFTKEATPVAGRKFTLLVTPKTAIDMQALAEVFAVFWGETENAAIERLRKGKGIVEQGLSDQQAKELLNQCAARGQKLLKALESYDVQYDEIFQAESVELKKDGVEWRNGPRIIEVPYGQIRMISAGMVRVSPQSGKTRYITSAYIRSPRVIACMWDSLLRVVDSSLKNLSGRDALRAMSAKLSDACPEAQITHAFHRTFESSSERPPLVFDSEEEFLNYNRWNLLVEEYWQKII